MYENEDEFCAPIYNDIEAAQKLLFTSKVISVPVKTSGDQLIFTLQIETDYEIDFPVS